MAVWLSMPPKVWVALLAEGVDRNTTKCCHMLGGFVALLAEGVDRNFFASAYTTMI